MAKPQRTREDDERVLRMLDMRDGENIGPKEISERFGVSRGAVTGLMDRVIRAERDLIDKCANPELHTNKDGTLGRNWWRK